MVTRQAQAFTDMLAREAPGSICMPLGTADGATLLAHRHAPAHEFVNPGGPYLGILAVPFFKCSEVLFDLGDGWRDHFCPDPRPSHVLPADTAFRWRVDGPSLTVMLAIPTSTVRGVFDELGVADPMQRLESVMACGFVDPLVYESVMRLWSQTRSEGACPALLVQSHLVTALHAVAVRGAAVPSGQARGAGLSKSQLAAVLDLMDERIQESLTLDELAAACRISRFHFVRQFRQSTGYSPYHYLQRRRVETARSLLASTRLPVSDIGAAVGLPDASHFSRTFTRHVGMSPQQYRLQGQ